MDEQHKKNKQDRHKEIDEELNPSKENYHGTATEIDVLDTVNLTEDEYYWHSRFHHI